VKRTRLVLLLALTVLLLYLLTLSRHWTADSLLFALYIDSSDPSLCIDTYHLLVHPAALLFVRLCTLLGYSGLSIVPLQALNALGGAVCVALFASIVHHSTGSARITSLTSAGLAVSGAMWLLSTDAEFVTLPLAVHLWVLWLLWTTPDDSVKRPVYGLLLGLAILLATLSYLTGLFLWPIALISIAARQDLPRDTRRRLLAVVSAVVLSGLGVLLLLSAPLWSGGEGRLWIARLLGGGVYGRWTWTSLPHGVYTFLRSLLLFPGLAMNESTRALLLSWDWARRLAFAAFYGLSLLVALWPLWLAWRGRGTVWPANRRVLITLLAWTLPYAAFAVWWVPGDLSFMLPVLIAWWLLLALTLPALPHAERWLASLVALLLLCNGALSIIPRTSPQTNERYTLAQDLAAHTAPDALVLLSGSDGMSWLHVSYFARRQVYLLPLASPDSPKLLSWTAREVADARSAGRSVWAVGLDDGDRTGLDELCSAASARLGSPCPAAVAPWTAAGRRVTAICAPE